MQINTTLSPCWVHATTFEVFINANCVKGGGGRERTPHHPTQIQCHSPRASRRRGIARWPAANKSKEVNACEYGTQHDIKFENIQPSYELGLQSNAWPYGERNNHVHVAAGLDVAAITQSCAECGESVRVDRDKSRWVLVGGYGTIGSGPNMPRP